MVKGSTVTQEVSKIPGSIHSDSGHQVLKTDIVGEKPKGPALEHSLAAPTANDTSFNSDWADSSGTGFLGRPVMMVKEQTDQAVQVQLHLSFTDSRDTCVGHMRRSHDGGKECL